MNSERSFFKSLFNNVHGRPCLCYVVGAIGFAWIMVVMTVGLFLKESMIDSSVIQFFGLTFSGMIMSKSMTDTIVKPTKE